MNSNQIDLLKNKLGEVLSISGIIGVAITDRNGLTITSELPRSFNEKSLGAMSATMFEAMEAATPEAKSKLSSITVEYDGFQVYITNMNSEALIVCILEYDLDLGLIFIEIEEFIKNLSFYLEER